MKSEIKLHQRQHQYPHLNPLPEGEADRTDAAKSNQELRQRILNLPGVTERQNAGIHEDAFFVGRTMFMHIHSRGHCDIRLANGDQERVLAEGKARPHRWAPEAGYVTFVVDNEEDLEPAMDLIRMAHHYFAGKQGILGTEHQANHQGSK